MKKQRQHNLRIFSYFLQMKSNLWTGYKEYGVGHTLCKSSMIIVIYSNWFSFSQDKRNRVVISNVTFYGWNILRTYVHLPYMNGNISNAEYHHHFRCLSLKFECSAEYSLKFIYIHSLITTINPVFLQWGIYNISKSFINFTIHVFQQCLV